MSALSNDAIDINGEKTGVAMPGVYTELFNDRPVDYELMKRMRVGAILIIQPDASKVFKVWSKIKDFNPRPKIVLRQWQWDDNRTDENPEGVYKELRESPENLGKKHARLWRNKIDEMRGRAKEMGWDFPEDSDIICHLINEPDTNTLTLEIDKYTFSACKLGTELGITLGVYNFGTGQPASLFQGRPDWRPFSLSLEAIRVGGHYAFFHEYFNGKGMLSASMMPWHIFRHRFAARELSGINCAITEWGYEGLVDGETSNHRGWNGKISSELFASNYWYYCTNVGNSVKFVLIFASNLSDPIWNSFDPAPAIEELQGAANKIWKTYWDNPDKPQEKVGSSNSSLVWPAKGALTQRFGENVVDYIARYRTPGHNGIDIANIEGTKVISISDGIVEWVGVDKDYGNYVRIWHHHINAHSFYAHLKEAIVRVGETVRLGDEIGRMGNTGHSTAPHLHFEIRIGERHTYYDIHHGHRRGRVNPETFFACHGLTWRKSQD